MGFLSDIVKDSLPRVTATGGVQDVGLDATTAIWEGETSDTMRSVTQADLEPSPEHSLQVDRDRTSAVDHAGAAGALSAGHSPTGDMPINDKPIDNKPINRRLALSVPADDPASTGDIGWGATPLPANGLDASTVVSVARQPDGQPTSPPTSAEAFPFTILPREPVPDTGLEAVSSAASVEAIDHPNTQVNKAGEESPRNALSSAVATGLDEIPMTASQAQAASPSGDPLSTDAFANNADANAYSLVTARFEDTDSSLALSEAGSGMPAAQTPPELHRHTAQAVVMPQVSAAVDSDKPDPLLSSAQDSQLPHADGPDSLEPEARVLGHNGAPDASGLAPVSVQARPLPEAKASHNTDNTVFGDHEVDAGRMHTSTEWDHTVEQKKAEIPDPASVMTTDVMAKMQADVRPATERFTTPDDFTPTPRREGGAPEPEATAYEAVSISSDHPVAERKRDAVSDTAALSTSSPPGPTQGSPAKEPAMSEARAKSVDAAPVVRPDVGVSSVATSSGMTHHPGRAGGRAAESAGPPVAGSGLIAARPVGQGDTEGHAVTGIDTGRGAERIQTAVQADGHRIDAPEQNSGRPAVVAAESPSATTTVTATTADPSRPTPQAVTQARTADTKAITTHDARQMLSGREALSAAARNTPSPHQTGVHIGQVDITVIAQEAPARPAAAASTTPSISLASRYFLQGF